MLFSGTTLKHLRITSHFPLFNGLGFGETNLVFGRVMGQKIIIFSYISPVFSSSVRYDSLGWSSASVLCLQIPYHSVIGSLLPIPTLMTLTILSGLSRKCSAYLRVNEIAMFIDLAYSSELGLLRPEFIDIRQPKSRLGNRKVRYFF
jgi:hypothetical protein